MQVADWAAIGGPPSRLIDRIFAAALANSGLALAMDIGARGPTNNLCNPILLEGRSTRRLARWLMGLRWLCGMFESLVTPANELNYRRMKLISGEADVAFDLDADGLCWAGGAALVLERRAMRNSRGGYSRRDFVNDERPADFAAGMECGCILRSNTIDLASLAWLSKQRAIWALRRRW
jgi:hypothetical protein